MVVNLFPMRNDPNLIAISGFREAMEMAIWRVENLLNRSAFARAIGSTYKTIRELENGKQRVEKGTYDKFCALRDLYSERNKGLSKAQMRHLKVYGKVKQKGKGPRSPWTKENNPLSKWHEERKRQEAIRASTQ